MAETAAPTAPNRPQLNVEFLNADGTPYASGVAEVAPVLPGVPQAPLAPDEWEALQNAVNRYNSGEWTGAELTMSDQALALHDEIYGGQNGVPSVDSFRAAAEFVKNVGIHFDPNAQSIDRNGNTVRGAYYTADGGQLPADIMEDLQHAANPGKWVQTASHDDVLARARDVLGNEDADMAAELPILEFAESIASRVAANPESVQADDLQRLIDLNAEARRMMKERHATDGQIDRAAQFNGADLAWSNRAPTASGRNFAPMGNTGSAQPANAEDESMDRLVRPEDMAINARNGSTAPVLNAEGRREYATNTDGTDTEILADLISYNEIMDAQDIAAYLYPEKVVGGTGQYGATRWRGQNSVMRVGDSSAHRYQDVLTEAERAEVEAFATQLGAARRLEAEVPQDFKDRIALPSHQEVAEELFPDVEKLTPAHWAVVRTTVGRLRAIRVGQTHRDRLLPIRMRWARIKLLAGDAWGKAQGFAEDAKEAAAVAKNKFGEFRAAAPGYVEQAQNVASNAHEVARPENLKALFGMAVGAVAVQGARLREEKPWQRVLPAIRGQVMENLLPAVRERVVPRMRGFVMNIEVGTAFREVSARIYMLAQDTARSMGNYLQERLQAARNMESGERNYRIAATATVLALASTLAIRAYLQYRHNIHTDTNAGGQGTAAGNDMLNNLDSGNNSHHTASDALDKATDDTSPKPQADISHKQATAEIGTFDSHKRIHGYPKGTVGYRVLEHAHQSGFGVNTRGQADRLIDATLKMDHMSWNGKVGVHTKIRLLSHAQMQEALGAKS